MQQFCGSNKTHNFRTSHKNEVRGCIKEEKGKKTMYHASLMYWLQCGISRLLPFCGIPTTINLFGNFLVHFLPFGQHLMGHHGRYGDRFLN